MCQLEDWRRKGFVVRSHLGNLPIPKKIGEKQVFWSDETLGTDGRHRRCWITRHKMGQYHPHDLSKLEVIISVCGAKGQRNLKQYMCRR